MIGISNVKSRTMIKDMNMKAKYITAILALLAFVPVTYAQEVQYDSEELKYRRSSLYSIMINHSEQKFADEIRTAFLEIPVPDKYNNHDLSIKVVDMNTKLKKAKSNKENETITNFIYENEIAGRMVARWFNRDKYTGICDMELVKERGLYNATEFDKQMAQRSARGIAMLQDAGEELIGNTFLLVNDIRYIDKEKRSSFWGGLASVAGGIAAAYTGIDYISDAADLAAMAIQSIKGFSVRINTFLYKLEWNDELANEFYVNQYASDVNDSIKSQNFENARKNYSLQYVGKVESKGSTTSFLGINEDQPVVMIRKACQRAIDENIVDLQTQYEEFRTNTPLVSVEPLTAYIGMKEGVSEDSRFEVLEQVEVSDGKYEYKRVGEIKPVKNMIWDNRYMAKEESAPFSSLGKTTFVAVSGKDFVKGMLIREISK